MHTATQGCSGAASEAFAVENERVVWAYAKKPEAVRQLVSLHCINGGCGVRWKENRLDTLIQAFLFKNS